VGFPTGPNGPATPGGAPPPPYAGPPGGAAGGPPAGPPAGPPVGPSGPYRPPPGGGSWFQRNRNWALPIGGIVLVLLLVVGYIVLSSDEASADEIFLEPVDFEGEDPFTDSVAAADAVNALDVSSDVEGSVSGDEEGLYGGTLNDSVCDREQLVEFLGDNDDKARAFADTLEIDVNDIPSYIASLTPVLLRGDTRVTNHGFADGEATSFQAVLQAGTAVLVDTDGVPRVKCYCGNPLTEPIEADSPTYRGDPWDDWDPDNITVTFEADTTINIFVITDIDTGDLFTRVAGTTGQDTPTGGEPPPTTLPPTTAPTTTLPPSTTAPLGTGDVQVTLEWAGGIDLDLHVIDPSGAEINYAARTSPSGGQLDQDAQGACGPCVENIFWPTAGAPTGEYQVFVVNFAGNPVTDYTVDIRVGGSVIDTLSGSVGGATPTSPTSTFTVS
jgi:Domain of unknown function (DUF6777)